MTDSPPSDQVHISPTKMADNRTAGASGPDHWSARGYNLKSILAKLYEVHTSRIDLPAPLDNGARYDFSVRLAQAEDRGRIERLVQEAIAERFQITMTIEPRLTDVYVLTAPKGRARAMKPAKDAVSGTPFRSSHSAVAFAVESPGSGPQTSEQITETGRKLLSQFGPGPIHGASSIEGLSVSGSTMADFCHTLELGLDRLVVDETSLKGTYDLKISGSARTPQELIALVQQQLGLVLTPEKRNVEMLMVRTRA
jgi:uncharacterized protein (TIGR03435 family)